MRKNFVTLGAALVVALLMALAAGASQAPSSALRPGSKVFVAEIWHSDEQASISVANLASGEVVFAYSANKKNSVHGKQTSAEACAKHLKEHVNNEK